MKIRLRDEDGNIHRMTEAEPKTLHDVLTDILLAGFIVLIAVGAVMLIM